MASSSTSGWQPEWAVPPGELLLEALQERGMSQAELSHRLGRPIKTVNEIIRGKAAITPETAIQLERALGISARFWTGLETQYRDAIARQDAARELAANADWIDGFPISDLVKHKRIERGGTKAATLANLLSFLGVSSPAAFDRLDAAAAYRASPAFKASPKALAAWWRWGEIEAAKVDLAAFDPARFREVLSHVRSLTNQQPFGQIIKRVQALCAEAGVLVLIVPELKGTHLNGAARWMGNKAVIQLTTRHKSNDQFWFTVFHEAGHLLSPGRRRDFIDSPDPQLDDADEERFANQFARNMLLPPGSYATFVATNDFSRDAVRRYAKEEGVAPGIVVGRLAYDNHIGPGDLSDLKRRVDLVSAM